MTVTQTTTEAQILEWTEQLCEALAENYKRYHYRAMTQDPTFANGIFAKKQIKEMNEGTAKLMRFRIQPGKKYLKIITQEFDTYNDINEYRDGSVHAFVDKQTGQIEVSPKNNTGMITLGSFSAYGLGSRHDGQTPHDNSKVRPSAWEGQN